MIGAFALDPLALERPFCVDTCVLTWKRAADGKTWVEPCANEELTVCPEAANCVIAKTRPQCLQASNVRRGGEEVEEREAIGRLEEKKRELEKQPSPVWG